MTKSIYCEAIWDYDFYKNKDRLINPRYFIIQGTYDPKAKKYKRIEIDTNQNKLEEIQQRMIEDGGYTIEDQELSMPTGILTRRISSGIVQCVLSRKKLVKRFLEKKGKKRKEYARRLLENARHQVRPEDTNYTRGDIDNILEYYGSNNPWASEDYGDDDDDEDQWGLFKDE